MTSPTQQGCRQHNETADLSWLEGSEEIVNLPAWVGERVTSDLVQALLTPFQKLKKQKLVSVHALNEKISGYKNKTNVFI